MVSFGGGVKGWEAQGDRVSDGSLVGSHPLIMLQYQFARQTSNLLTTVPAECSLESSLERAANISNHFTIFCLSMRSPGRTVVWCTDAPSRGEVSGVVDGGGW